MRAEGGRPNPTYAWQQLSRKRVALGKRTGEPCCMCGLSIDYALSGAHPEGPTTEHLVPFAHGGEFLPPLEELGVAHRRCQSAQGARIANYGRKSRKVSGASSSGAGALPRALKGSPPPLTIVGRKSAETTEGTSQNVTGSGPSWGNTPSGVFATWEDVPWVADLLPVPEDATWPSHMTAPHPRATGSYGLAAEEWLLETMKMTLRWWQRLALRRQLEHDETGALVWRTIIESTPRRSGKSVRLRAVALWRLHQAASLGEEQLILLTGKDLPIVREIIRRAWPWAITAGYPVRKANGQEEIEAMDGSRWIVRGKDSVYGYDVCLGLVDEAWGVDQGVVDDGLEPALLERIQPQLVMTSTAHRSAKSLMRTRRHAALEQLAEPTDVLLLQWSAPADSEPGDRAAWRVASPHWTQDREDMLARTLQRIMAGTADPDPDEPDPMEAFRAQYLNIWPAPRHGVTLWISPDLVSTAGSATPLELGPVKVGALATSADGSQWSAAVSDGDRAIVAVGISLEGALTFLGKQAPAEVLVYQAEAHQIPTSMAVAVKVVTLGEDIAAAATLADSVRSGSVAWFSQGTTLAEQFANVVMAPGSGGPRIAARLSRGPVDGVVALSRAHWRAVHSAPEAGAVW